MRARATLLSAAAVDSARSDWNMICFAIPAQYRASGLVFEGLFNESCTAQREDGGDESGRKSGLRRVCRYGYVTCANAIGPTVPQQLLGDGIRGDAAMAAEREEDAAHPGAQEGSGDDSLGSDDSAPKRRSGLGTYVRTSKRWHKTTQPGLTLGPPSPAVYLLELLTTVHGSFLTSNPPVSLETAAGQRHMSPPNQSPHLDEAPDAPREPQLENGLDKPAAPVNATEEQPVEDASQKTEVAQQTGEGGDAGQPAKVKDSAGQPPDTAEEKENKAEDLGNGKEAQNEAPAATAAADVATEKGQEVLPATADPVDEITTQTERANLSSTPPPEPTPKAAGKAPVRSPSPPPPPPKDVKYLSSSNVPSRTTSPVSQGKSSGRNSEDAEAAAYSAKYESGEEAEDSRSEIQSIMEQFEHGHGGAGAQEIMSPRLELAAPLLDSAIAHPPRRSSLAPIDKPLPTPTDGPATETLQSPPPRTSSLYRVGTNTSLNEPMSPNAHAPQYKPVQPIPEPEQELPFDFHRFLEQLRHRTADPVAKFLRSFLLEFGKKQWMVHEQVKIIGDFLEFISKKMAQCEIWRTVSDQEFDNAREGMEKLVMNRLYNQTFSPAIPPPEAVPKGRRRQDGPGPGRRGQHQEDVERDEVLAQKVRIYKWVREDHLDIKPVGEKGRKFLNLAQQELLKIKSYRAPRDKVICILNCCKVIFGYLRTSKSDQSADAFVPLLIYTVLQANPEHLVSNVQYILRFRNQEKLGGEAGYYISSLMGAIQFIEGLDRTSLTVSDEEFEKNVEAAVSAIAERHEEPESSAAEASGTQLRAHPPMTPGHRRMPSPHLHLSEKSTLSRPEVTQRNSLEAEQAGPRRSTSLRQNRGEVEPPPEEENAAVAGLLRTIQRPLSTIGRIFSDTDTNASSHPVVTPQPGSTPRSTPQPPRRSSDYPGNAAPASEKEMLRKSTDEERYRQRLSAEESAARQASAEVEEAKRIQRQEHKVVVETLAGMFPQLDRDVIDDVVRMKEGRLVPHSPIAEMKANVDG
ncbi:hypothetical protein BS50DRAFT_651058 [Corynespora cassiicola Philippines]|uniref:VPS9 domain-containing protein n=1 Tax=Corynespora cassiicola Philippines TaxID=1448308 RepID=A0A2T2N8C9_CORCC|nr:hypothetical protein BS50DRAFT_651058 [Corynespora cassiicola Philippines]